MIQTSFPGFCDYQSHLGAIRNYYWQIRAVRSYDGAKRRWLYRQVAKHKAVLIAAGVDAELLRLWCRQFSRCYPEASRERFEAYLQNNSTILKKTR